MVVDKIRAALERAVAAEEDLRCAEAEVPGTIAHRRADDEAHAARNGLRLTVDDARSLLAEVDRLRVALEPFTKFRIERATPWAEENAPWSDDHHLTGYDGVSITVGMVRASRAALSQ